MHRLLLSSALLLVTCTVGTQAKAEYMGDPRIPDYGSSAHQQRHDADKNYPGDRHGTPYMEPPSNTQRWNEEQSRRDAQDQQRREAAERQRQDAYRDLYREKR